MESAERVKSLKVSHQLTLADTLRSKVVYNKESDCYRVICKKLAIFIGNTNVLNSIHVVENLEFKDLLHTTDSHFVVPARSVIGKEIDKVLIELKAKIGSYLLEAHKISICVDIWSKRECHHPILVSLVTFTPRMTIVDKLLLLLCVACPHHIQVTTLGS